jgi:hypothetical protein
MKYDFLIQNYIGQTIRRPVDFVCIGYGSSEKIITIIEAKKDIAELDHLVQLLNYQEVFRIRNVREDRLNYRFSPCLLAKRFQPELIKYCSLRNMFIPWEEIILIAYTPISGGADATFTVQTLPKPSSPFFATYSPPKIKTDISQIHSDPQKFYSLLGKRMAPKTGIEVLSLERDVIVLRKYYQANGLKSTPTLGYVLIYTVAGKCEVGKFIEFMRCLYEKVKDYKEKFMAIEPILIAEDYDKLVTLFIEQYNKHETQAMRQPISYYILS